MKEPMENSAREWKWDDSLENSQDFIDAAVLLPDEEALLVDGNGESRSANSGPRHRPIPIHKIASPHRRAP